MRCCCFRAAASPCGPLTRPAKLADPAALQKDGEPDTIRTPTPPRASAAASLRAAVLVVAADVEGRGVGGRHRGWENVVIHRKGQSASQDTGERKTAITQRHSKRDVNA